VLSDLVHDGVVMESRQIRYFCEVAEAGSFTAAASRLRVAQPALSRQIAALERELGTQFFIRGAGGVTLTPSGEILLRHADAIRLHAARAREEISTSVGHVAGWVSLGTAPAIGHRLFGVVADRINQRFPQMRMSFIEGVGASLLSGLEDGTLDLAITSKAPNNPGIVFQKLFSEPVYLVAEAGAALPARVSGWGDLAGFPLVVTNQQTTVASWVEEQAAFSRTALDLRYRVESSRAALDLVQRGLAYGVLPKSILEGDVAGDTLQKILMDDIVLERHLAWSKNREVSVVFQALCEIVAEEVAAIFPAETSQSIAELVGHAEKA
jgi:LysR family transcriptional regulator, nitrogen assimilation regulatory protein